MNDSNLLLEIKDLCVSIDDKEILRDINLRIPKGETHVIFGPNGGGKTTLLMTLMGFPKYKITHGKIIFKGVDITELPLNQRAVLGIGIAYQRPPVVKGVKTGDLVQAIVDEHHSDLSVEQLATEAHMQGFLFRDINAGFSGGETKRSEMMQILAQDPSFVLLDEPESGVDLENIALIGDLINQVLDKKHSNQPRQKSGLIITHTGHILEYVNARTGHIMMNGRIHCNGDPRDMLQRIKDGGYAHCNLCAGGKH